MKLWQYEIKPIAHPAGVIFLRATKRNTKTHIDYDISGSGEQVLKVPGLVSKAQHFVSSLGFSFPLPLPTVPLCRILTFKIPFPSHDDWLKIIKENDYSLEERNRDASLILVERLTPPTPQDAIRNLIRAASPRSLWPLSLQDQASYARNALHCWARDKERLGKFYNIIIDSELVNDALSKLRYKSSLHLPDHSRSAKSRKVEEPSKKKARSNKKVDFAF